MEAQAGGAPRRTVTQSAAASNGTLGSGVMNETRAAHGGSWEWSVLPYGP